MICKHCARSLARRTILPPLSPSTTTLRRAFTTTPRRFEAAATTNTTDTSSPPPNGHPAATSTSAAQPFTAGTASKPRPSSAAKASSAAQIKRQPSSAPEGFVLKGINYMKNKQDPIALADEEYPEWLWQALDKKESADDGADGDGDQFSKSKKERRRAAKALRKRQLSDPESLQPKVPIYEQSIDLYAGDGTLEGAKQAVAARQVLTKAMRDARRAKIKESNFLKAMS